MKAIIPIILIVVVAAGIIYFNSDKRDITNDQSSLSTIEGEEVSSDFQGTYVFDSEASEAKWTGSKKIIKDYFDNGTIDIKSGMVIFQDGEIEGGEIIFDMTTITALSTGRGDGQDMLTTHLKSEDFFEVETYPEARYEVTGSEKTSTGYTLEGQLTVKGNTHPVKIPVQAVMDNGNIIISGNTTIDRTDYDVRFGSESFFNDLGDNVISDEFILEFNIVARP